jgi:hypothetical protein
MSQEAGTTQKLFTYLIIPADEAKPIRRTAAMMRVKPEEQELRAIIEPYLDGFIMILVTALIGDEFRDMFIDALDGPKELARNNRATILYQDSIVLRHREDREVRRKSLPYIDGTAVLFDEPVWFD